MNQYFYEDLVYTLLTDQKKVKFGLVLENFELNDESLQEEDVLKKGEIRVAWYPGGRDEIVKEQNVSAAYIIQS